MRKCLIILFAFLAAFEVRAQDSLSVNERTMMHIDNLAASGNASAMRFAPSYGLLSPYVSFLRPRHRLTSGRRARPLSLRMGTA